MGAKALGRWGRQMVFGLTVAAVAVCLSGKTASAQSRMDLLGGYSYGSDGLSFYCGYGCGNGLQGYAADFTYNLSPYIGLEGAFTGHRGSGALESEVATSSNNGYSDNESETMYVYTFGPRLTLPARNFTLFTHLLAGGLHMSDNYSNTCIPATGSSPDCYSTETGKFYGSGFAFKTGGGVNWNHGAWGIRLLELNYVHGEMPLTETSNEYGQYHFQGSTSGFEMVTGVTFSIGTTER
ncbi:MAG TPA: hypothetical protein VMB47_13890 [Candidatus Aquilonibacter sp.]|nr:hypothetical protein [Candidatus Aquilonibacter sp.]